MDAVIHFGHAYHLTTTNILLIDNKSKLLTQLQSVLSDHTLTTFSFDQIVPKCERGFDCIILSGGSRYAVLQHLDKYEREIELIQSTSLPIFGICIGFELICHAFGEKIETVPTPPRIGIHQI